MYEFPHEWLNNLRTRIKENLKILRKSLQCLDKKTRAQTVTLKKILTVGPKIANNHVLNIS